MLSTGYLDEIAVWVYDEISGEYHELHTETRYATQGSLRFIGHQTVIEVPADLMPHQNFRCNCFIVRGIGSATLGLMFNEGLQ